MTNKPWRTSCHIGDSADFIQDKAARALYEAMLKDYDRLTGLGRDPEHAFNAVTRLYEKLLWPEGRS